MALVAQSHIAATMQLLQGGIGHNTVQEWFTTNNITIPASTTDTKESDLNNVSITGRIELYRHALSFRGDFEQFLNFQLCRLRVSRTRSHTSALGTFINRWPNNVANTIQHYLIPSKRARQTLQQVSLYFVATLNEYDSKGQTSLHTAIVTLNIQAFDFLLKQDGLALNKLSTVHYKNGTSQQKTPLSVLMDLPNELETIVWAVTPDEKTAAKIVTMQTLLCDKFLSLGGLD